MIIIRKCDLLIFSCPLFVTLFVNLDPIRIITITPLEKYPLKNHQRDATLKIFLVCLCGLCVFLLINYSRIAKTKILFLHASCITLQHLTLTTKHTSCGD